MKILLGLVELLALVELAVAQKACLGLTTLFPSCALPCRCNPVSSSSIQNLAVGCVIAACTRAGELGSAIAAGPSICGCVATAVPDTTTTSEAPTTTTTTSESQPTLTLPSETTSEPPSQTTDDTTSLITSTASETSPTQGCDPKSPCQASVDAVPSCAQACISSAAVTSASCSFGDLECQCSSTAVIQNAAQGCVIGGCGLSGAIQVLDAVSNLCGCVSANPTTPCTETGTKPPTQTETQPTDTATQPTLTQTQPTDTETQPTGTETQPTDTETQPTVTETQPTETETQPTGTETDTQTGTQTCSQTETQTGSHTETGTQTETQTKSDTATGGATCTAVTTQDCGPVASTAIPKCAQACFTKVAPSIGCDVDDYTCQCQDEAQSSLSQLLVPCVVTACDSGDLPAIITGASSVCACATAEPPANGCTTTGGPTETTSETTSQPPSNTQTGTRTETQPTKTQPPDTTTTCPEATTEDCGPVATSAVPSCAHACFSSAAPKVGCGAEDYACQCESEAQASLSQLLIPCVATACAGSDLPAVITGASSVCACANAAPTGGCSTTGKPTGGSDTTTTTTSKTVPTKTATSSQGPGGGTTTCAEATTSDCGPVASSAVPSCAQACFSSAAPKVGCGVHDYACQCQAEAQASLSQLLIPCVATACDSGQLPGVITGAASVCACATAPPSGGGCGGPGGTTSSGGHGTKTESSGHSSKPTQTGGSGHGTKTETCSGDSSAPTSTDGGGHYSLPTNTEGGGHYSLPTNTEGGGHYSLPTNTEGGGHYSLPTGTGGGSNSETSTCVPGALTTADCGPVASSAVPSCAHACFSSAAPNVGCGAEDYACQCEPDAQASLSQLLVPCVATACDSNQLAAVITGASSVCACAQAEPTGSNDCESGSGGDSPGEGHSTKTGGNNGGGSITTCVTVTRTGSNGSTTTSFSCDCVTGDQTITKELPTATGESGGHHSEGGNGENESSSGHEGSNGEHPTGKESSNGEQPTGNEAATTGSESAPPSETGPLVVKGSAARFEIGIVAGVFGAFWLAVVVA
ncbi:hypothetical protein B0T10DRAFT_543170 [Thelonectria olida]|uniref:CFEM domain-containing protein n=1 Tax=Thelonectria olida TaxID=1576542 RepID=A0A9P8WEW8_9HYPO|nr:hypothetical protein B0T10DRAFT_543170 [Thelonectria olida]